MTSCKGSWLTRAYNGVIAHGNAYKDTTTIIAVPLNRIYLFKKLVYPIRWLLKGERVLTEKNIVREFDYFIYYSIRTSQILGSIWTGRQRINIDDLKKYKVMKIVLHPTEFLSTYGQIENVKLEKKREITLFSALDVYSLFMRTLMVDKRYLGHAAWYITYITQRQYRVYYRLFFMLAKIIDYHPNQLCENEIQELASLIISAGSGARLRAGKAKVLLVRPILDGATSTYSYDYMLADLNVCIPMVTVDLYPDYRDRVIPVLAIQPIVRRNKRYIYLKPSIIPLYEDDNNNELINLFILSAVFLMSPYLEERDGFIRIGEIKKRAKKIMKRLGIVYKNNYLFNIIEKLISKEIIDIRTTGEGQLSSQSYIRVRDPYEIMYNLIDYRLGPATISYKYNIPLSVRDLRCLLFNDLDSRYPYLVI